MKKTFVLDANVLLHDPQSIHSFKDNDVVIILSILSEIDSFKKNLGEIGVNAREVARELDRLSNVGSLSNGVPVGEGGRLFVYAHHHFPLTDDIKQNVDSRVISETMYLTSQGHRAIIVSKDIMLRVIATSLGVSVEDYKTDSKQNESYSGIVSLSVDKDTMDEFAANGEIMLEGYEGFPNQFVHMTLDSDEKKSLLGRTRADGLITIIYNKNHSMLNIKPRNLEQIFAAEALLDDSVKLVTLGGRAGTGKTLLAVAAGLSKLSNDTCSRIVITRPVIPVGRDLGYLPGSLSEKMDPWMKPIYDAVDMIREADYKNAKSVVPSKAKLEEVINIAPLAYIRGRSIPNSFMIIDECLGGDSYVSTNLGKKKIKNIVSWIQKGKGDIFANSFNEDTMSFEFKKIVSGCSKGVRETIKVIAGGVEVRCTNDHPFLTDEGWKKSGELNVGDLLVSTNGFTAGDRLVSTSGFTVVDKIVSCKATEVFDIEVEDNHNFVVFGKDKDFDDGIVVHNCQNISPKEIKTLITRCGEGTKIVLTGDVDQIDDPFLDRASNGFSYLISKFKKYDIHAHVQLVKGERSPLAEIAANIL